MKQPVRDGALVAARRSLFRLGAITTGDLLAKAAAGFLLKEGVADTRLWTASHGSDQPVSAEEPDACAAKNRRVHFELKKQ